MSAYNIGSDGVRFLIAGIVNNILTFGIYQILLFFFEPTLAYILTWLLGLIVVAAIYPSNVFRDSRTDGMARLSLAATYLFVFFIGLILIRVLEGFDFNQRISIVFVIFITAFANFIIGRYVTRER